MLELTQQVAGTFQALLIEKGIECAINGEAVLISADRDKIHQVVTNLLYNAIKFTPSGGHIDLQVSQISGAASFKITDTGQGIPPNEINQVFERFYMAEPSRNRKLGGQGIGLSIVKSIIKAHHGNITVKSDYGKGSTFTVILPVKR